ncbi:hypothetical protein FHT87_004148 [Rhizobium sp. BK316]|nr:hypothetical protein [Rhizobium sp. BK316]
MKSNVDIVWSDIARDKIVAPGRYVAPAKFGADPDWPQTAWSIVLEFSELSHGTARFLVDDAPHHLLQRGATFEMYDGRKLSAKVRVL